MAKKRIKIERVRHEIDASGESLGRLACRIARLLRGKHKTEFVPHIDLGDFVVITNIKKIKFTGKKFQQKVYYSHSGYPGGLKVKKLSELFEKRPEEVLKRAVRGMLPNNKLRPNMLKRLTFKK